MDRKLIAQVLASVAIFIFLWIIRTIYLHPLAKFKGPRGAKFSNKWLWQHYRNGFPEATLDALHKKYDTRALRIAPNEIHISDVSLYKTIYSQKADYLKDGDFYQNFNSPHTVFVETDQKKHRVLRKALSPSLSRSSVSKLEPIFRNTTREMGAKIRECSVGAGPINVANPIRCLTVDVISEFAFGRSVGLLGSSDASFRTRFLEAFDLGAAQGIEKNFNVFLKWASKMIPLEVLQYFFPIMKEFSLLRKFAVNSLHQYNEKTSETTHPVLFDSLKPFARDLQVGQALELLVAGADTTAFTLTTGIFHILQNPKIEERLVKELEEVIPDPENIPSLQSLEQIQYLWACIKESLRVAMPVPGILPRVVPKNAQSLVVDGQCIPPGTVVGISAYTMHTSASIWGSDAMCFNPDRWLGPNQKELDSYLCAFSKGARQCIGINLAYAEATALMAYFFRNFKMILKSTEFKSRDIFTQLVLEPGVLVDFVPRIAH